MTTTRTVAIVGAGLAGANAAATLRKEGFDGRVVLIRDEPVIPYELPPLSKGYLRGEDDFTKASFRDASFYEEQAIELRTGTTVTSVDVGRRAIATDRGDEIRWDALLLATGSRPRRLDVQGAGLAGIHTLRTIGDADAIRDAAAKASRAIVVGGGWIGAEVAASLRQLGLPVVIVARTAVLLEAVLGRDVGAVYDALHAEHGVELHMGDDVTRFVADGPRVRGVETASGTRLDGDLVVVGVGATPRLELARGAGLTIGAGVVVDETLAARSDVFAAGDIAEAWHPTLGRRVRIEHWDNAKRQGAAAARNILGAGAAYDRLPYFYSDQFDLGMEYVGHAESWDEVVVRGDPGRREFIAFWLADGRPVAAMNANIWGISDELRSIVGSGRRIDARRLADADVPLADLLPADAAA